MKPIARAGFALALALSASLLAGCGDDSSSGGEQSATETPQDSSPAAADDDGTATELTAQDAAGVALEEVSGAVVEIDRDDDGGSVVWEVVVREDDGNGVELDIDVATGEVRHQGNGDVPDEAEAGPPQVTAVQAMDTAIDETGGAVRDLGLDDDNNNRVVWEVEVQTDSGRVDVTVDGTSGDVIETDTDDDDDDDDDD